MGIDDTERGAAVSRRALIKRGAMAGGVALWASPVVQSLTAPVGALYAECCRFTGGGGSSEGSASRAPATGLSNVTHYGFELHCGPNPPHPNRFTVSFDDPATPGRQLVTFHLDGTTFQSRCTPPPATTPNAPCSSITGSGAGSVTGPGALRRSRGTVDFTIHDGGEPGFTGDSLSLTVTYTDSSGVTRTFSASGTPSGNLQAHSATGSKSNCT